MGNPTQTTLVGQLAFAPLALVTSLFRPFLFEADSFLVAVNALETAAILFLTIRALARRGFGGAWRLISESPMLVFFTLFTLGFGVAVGLTTTNLGALSRYRVPLVPFFWGLVLILDSREFGAVAARADRTRPALPVRRDARRPLPAHAAAVAKFR